MTHSNACFPVLSHKTSTRLDSAARLPTACASINICFRHGSERRHVVTGWLHPWSSHAVCYQSSLSHCTTAHVKQHNRSSFVTSVKHMTNSHCIAPSAADRWMCPGQQASLDCRRLVLECLMYSGVHLAMQLCKPCSWRLLARRLDASRTPATCACCTKWSRHARLASQLQSSWQMFLPIRYAGTLGRSPASTFVEWHVFQRCHYMQSAAHGTC